MSKKSFCLFVLFWLIFGNRTVLGQVTTATVSGTVQDETKGVLPGATVTVKNLDTGITRTVITDDLGLYRTPGLAPGNYEISAELVGFKTELIRGIKLAVAQEAVINFTLRVGEITEKIVVTEEAPAVDTTSSTLAYLVDDKKIRDLPLNGRSFGQLALLQPGVVMFGNPTQGPIGGRGVKISVAGGRPSDNLFLFDGTEANDGYNNTPGSIAGVLLGVDTVREFQTLTSTYSAEYGRAAGGVINAVTRSGTNEFHGSFFEFHRNSALDAHNFFDDPTKKAPPFKRNQFGGTFGGPFSIPGRYDGKDRSFVFLSYEGLRERLGVTKVAIVPNEAARRGILPRGPVGINPAMKPFIDLYPLPNGRDFGDGTGEFLFSQSQPTDENFFLIRADHKLSEADSFFVRYIFDDALSLKPLELPIFGSSESSRNQYFTMQETKILSPTLLNTFRFGFNRSRTDAFDKRLDPRAAPSAQLPEFIKGRGRIGVLVTFGGVSPLPHDASRPFPALSRLNLFDYADNITYTRGRHSIKAGANIKRYQFNITQGFQLEGNYEFANLEKLLTAEADRFFGASPETDPIRGWRQTLFGLFFQDDFRFRPNLTLNLGLRYEFHTVPTEVNGKVANLRNPLDPRTTVGDPFFENPSLKNWAPRFGFAWDPFKDGKTSVRGGFGIFHDQILARWYLTSSFQTPFFLIVLIQPPPFPDPFAGRIIPLPNLQPIQFSGLRTPYKMQYNLNIQREIFSDTVFSIAYVGSRGVHLARVRDWNGAIPQILPDGSKFFPAFRPRNPNFGTITGKSSEANSFYNSLQLSVNKRFSHGLQFQAAYTFSKSVDDASTLLRNDADNVPQQPLDPDDRTRDRGLSTFDVRHNLVFNYSYDLPVRKDIPGPVGKVLTGWQISGITAFASGNPFTINNAFSRARNIRSGGVDRPNLRPGASRNPRLGNPARWFDPGAFELQPAGFLGNLGKNTVIGPGLIDFDFSLIKNTSINERTRVQFRVEFFNLFNHPNFATPDSPARVVFLNDRGDINGSAGKITRTVTTSRQIQFGLKFIF